MTSVTLNGPIVKEGANNVVLREALIHSPVQRLSSSTDCHKVEIGVREGNFTTWVGTWDQSVRQLEAAAPTSILDMDRVSMRLRGGQAIVVKVTAIGSPASLRGTRLNFRLARVGGINGPARPLVSSGASLIESRARTAVVALERQVNQGLSEWEESVQLLDPVGLAPTGTFHGRLQVDSTTQISLQRHNGDWVEVDGEAVSVGSSGLAITSTDDMVESTGTVGSTSPSTSTLYYAYLHPTIGLRLSATAPSSHRGVKYLGTTGEAARWRFCGWVYSNGSTQFVDDATNRHCVNYHNRLVRHILLTPGYNDNNAATTYTTTSTTYTEANSGTGSRGSYIANGEDSVLFRCRAFCLNSGANITCAGIGDNSTTATAAVAEHTGTTLGHAHADYASTPTEGYRTVSLLVCVSAGTGTFNADFARRGNAEDPRGTLLIAEIRA